MGVNRHAALCRAPHGFAGRGCAPHLNATKEILGGSVHCMAQQRRSRHRRARYCNATTFFLRHARQGITPLSVAAPRVTTPCRASQRNDINSAHGFSSRRGARHRYASPLFLAARLTATQGTSRLGFTSLGHATQGIDL